MNLKQAQKPNGMLGSIMLKIMNTAHTKMYKWVLREIKIREDSIVLDVGCGGGKTIKLFSEKNPHRIYGIDYSEQAVKEAIKANKEDVATGKVQIQQASVIDIPFPDNSFNIVTAFQTHYFWPDFEKSLKEIYRVLKT